MNAPLEKKLREEKDSSSEKFQAIEKIYEQDMECGSWEQAIELEAKADTQYQPSTGKYLKVNPNTADRHPELPDGFNDSTFASFIESELGNLKPLPMPPILTTDASLEMRLDKAGFRYTSTKMSRVVFKRIEALYSEKEINDSIASVLADPTLIPTAVALEQHLAKTKSRRQQNKGQVAL